MFQNFEPPQAGSATAARLGALRDALADAGVEGFLVPRADRHQGETVPAAEERLAWLTGFTGSAGLAVVLPGRAALFVDGRYTLQAERQSGGDALEVVHTRDLSAEDWLAEAAPEAKIGFDPWLHTRAEIDRFDAALRGPLVALPENPIDRIWEDRPPLPMGAVTVHPESLAGESVAAKRARIGKALGDGAAAAAIITLPDSIAWLLNIRGSDLTHVPVALGFAVLHRDGAVDLYMEPDKIDDAVEAHLGDGVTLHPPDAFGAGLDALSGQTVRVDKRTAALWVSQRLEAAGAEIAWGPDPCLLPKAQKNATELEGMRAAHLRDGAAVTRALAWLDRAAEAGETPSEIEIARRFEAERMATGALLDLSFDTISASAGNGAQAHYRVNRESDRALQPGEIMLVDSGAQYADGTTDITRTVSFGPVREDAIEPYTLVLKGMIALCLARWPEGLAGRDLDALARAALWQAGLDYDHGTGHGVGSYLDVHEGPASISRRSGDVALMPGMVLSNEPGYYRAGAFGIRLEVLVAVTPPEVPRGGERAMLGFETLTLAPFDRRLIDRALLSEAEIAWLDAYHARVLAALRPHLDDETIPWAERACAPLGPKS